jgi:tripartite-type tricarboxylate transporter receptor subunit TctC
MKHVPLAIIVACVAFANDAAYAQSYPSKPVRIVVPYVPGGPVDDVARVLGQRLSEMWAQTVITDNRGGAGGSIGADLVVKSPPDGYTLLLGNAGPITINPSLMKKLPYDPQKDLQPITLVVISSQVLVVHPQLPARSFKELIALAKARPGQLNYGSAGVGNLQHLAMEALQSVSGTKMNHVPYKGAAPAYVDLIAGQIQLMFANIVGALPHVKSGRARALAVSSLKRSAELPAVPTVAESYAGFEAISWMGLFAPVGTSNEIVLRIQADTARVLARQDVQERLARQGAEVVGSGPEQLREFTRKESALYAGIIRSTGMTAD